MKAEGRESVGVRFLQLPLMDEKKQQLDAFTQELKDRLDAMPPSEALDFLTPDEERMVPVLYAVLARDPIDFLDALVDASDRTLRALYRVLSLPNTEYADLNAIGASMVLRHLAGRATNPTLE